ncbi:MAG: hypothetical protein ACRCV6_08540 [Formosimonas sp.]
MFSEVNLAAHKKERVLYVWFPYFLAILMAYLLSNCRSLIEQNPSVTHPFVTFMGGGIPMLEGLKVAVNYSLFIGFSYAVFWLFTPFVFVCGWKVVSMSSRTAQNSFLKKSKLLKFWVYFFSFLFSAITFLLAWPVEHKGSNEPYLFDTFLGLFFDFSGQGFCFFMLGVVTKYFFLDFKLCKGVENGE